jgi:hypothetical protein
VEEDETLPASVQETDQDTSPQDQAQKDAEYSRKQVCEAYYVNPPSTLCLPPSALYPLCPLPSALCPLPSTLHPLPSALHPNRLRPTMAHPPTEGTDPVKLNKLKLLKHQIWIERAPIFGSPIQHFNVHPPQWEANTVWPPSLLQVLQGHKRSSNLGKSRDLDNISIFPVTT